MDWIRVKDGYVRSDAIIDVHVSPYCSVFFHLASGYSVKLNDFETEAAAWEVVEKIVDHLDKL